MNHKPEAKGELRSLGATSRPAAASRNVRGCLDLGLPLPERDSIICTIFLKQTQAEGRVYLTFDD